MNAASLVAVSVAGVMIVCAILLIATTIRLSAFSRRRETGIMRLVGASKMVIQLPFILEGVIAAVIGAALASGTLWAVAHFFLGGVLSKQYPDTAFISAGPDADPGAGPDRPWRAAGRHIISPDPPPIPAGLAVRNEEGTLMNRWTPDAPVRPGSAAPAAAAAWSVPHWRWSWPRAWAPPPRCAVRRQP